MTAPGLLCAFNLIDSSDTHQTLTLYGKPLEKISLFHSATGLLCIQKQSYVSGYESQRQNIRVGWVDLVGWPWVKCLSSVATLQKGNKVNTMCSHEDENLLLSMAPGVRRC